MILTFKVYTHKESIVQMFRYRKATNKVKFLSAVIKQFYFEIRIKELDLDINFKTILDYVEIAKQEGGVVLTGGVKYTENGCDKGNFVRPTLITNVNNGCRISQEEVFGPVAVIIKFKTDDEVIAQANDSEYGLGGAVFTKNINRALRLAREIQTGRVWVNTYNQIPEHAPFGGYKKSGIGRETHKARKFAKWWFKKSIAALAPR